MKILNTNPKIIHKPIFLKEVINYLDIKKNGIYIDATLGLGGHSKVILSLLTTGTLICVDQDKNQIKNFKNSYPNLIKEKNIIFVNDKFSNLKKHLIKNKIKKIDGILYDLGPCNNQILNKSRGFSYHLDSKIDMRFNQNQELSAYSILNNASKKDLVSIFQQFKNYKYSNLLANRIIEERNKNEINSTIDFVKLIKTTLSQKKLKEQKHQLVKYF